MSECDTMTNVAKALSGELEARQVSAALRERFQAGFRRTALTSIVRLAAMVSPDSSDEVRAIITKMLRADRACARACERIKSSAEDET